MKFLLIDKDTGREVSDKVVSELAKNSGLMTSDIDQFAITEDGNIVLLDGCGKFAYIPGNYKVIVMIEGEI